MILSPPTTRTLTSPRFFSLRNYATALHGVPDLHDFPLTPAHPPVHPSPRAHMRAHELALRHHVACPRRGRQAGAKTQPPTCAAPATSVPSGRRATPRATGHRTGAARPCRRRPRGRAAQSNSAIGHPVESHRVSSRLPRRHRVGCRRGWSVHT